MSPTWDHGAICLARSVTWVMAPPVKGGVQSVAGGSSVVQVEVRYDQSYDFIGRPRAETLGIIRTGTTFLFCSLLLMWYGFGIFIPMRAYLACCSSFDYYGSLVLRLCVCFYLM